MNAQSQKIFQKVLILSPIERAELVEKIFESFNFKSRKKIDELWINEAEDRIDAYDQGKIKSISARKVFKSIT